MSPNNPTVKQSLQVHAAILREMAEVEKEAAAACYKHAADYGNERIWGRAGTRCDAALAALLAGAAALEAVLEARGSEEEYQEARDWSDNKRPATPEAYEEGIRRVREAQGRRERAWAALAKLETL